MSITTSMRWLKSTTGLTVLTAARCWTPTSHGSCRLNTGLTVHAQAKCMKPSANSSTSFIKSGSRTPALTASSCSWPAVAGQVSPAQVNCWPTYSRQPTSSTTARCLPTARPRDASRRRLMQVRTCTSPTSTANPWTPYAMVSCPVPWSRAARFLWMVWSKVMLVPARR